MKQSKGLSPKTRAGGVALCLLSLAAPASAATSINALEQQLIEQQRTLAAQQQLIERMQRELAETKAQQRQVETKQQQAEVKQAEVEKKAAERALDPDDDSLSVKPSAASKVTLYGRLDMGGIYQKNNGGPGTYTRPNSNSYFAFNGAGEFDNSLGLRGEYKVASDWIAGFNMRGTTSLTGSTPTWSPFNKEFNLSLNFPYGKVIIGTQQDPAWAATGKGDPRDTKNILSATAGAWSFGQGYSSSPQTDMFPTNSFSYGLEQGPVRFGALYKPGGNTSSNTTPLNGNHVSGQQASTGITYDDKTYLLTAGYMTKFATNSSANRGMDVRNYSVAAGYYWNDVLFRAGLVDVYLPHGNQGFSGLGTISGSSVSLAQALKEKMDIRIFEAGAKWSFTSQDSLDFSYYKSEDQHHEHSGADWYVLGYGHNFTKRLKVYGVAGITRTQANSTALVDATSPNLTAAPGKTTFTLGSGASYTF